jgi:hypothetical protein
MQILRFAFFFLFGISWLFTGCSSDPQAQRSGSGLRPMPLAFGKIRELTVVMDNALWKGRVGDTLDYYYAGPYLLLPQPEPILDIRHFTAQELLEDPLRKELRLMLFVCDLSDEQSLTSKMVRQDLGEEKIRRARENPGFRITVGRDKWAKEQTILYLFGFSEEELVNNLKRSMPVILDKIDEVDMEKLDATVYLDGENTKLVQLIRDRFKFNMRVPGEYVQALFDENVLWMRRETPDYSSSILVSTLPYTDPAQLTRQGLKQIRDSIGRKYISSELPNTFMKINDEDLPFLTDRTTVSGKYALEGRGIWEIENDYMGGPFLSLLIHQPEENQLIFLDGFVYAPGKDKRNNMLYLEHIFDSVRL